MPQHTDLNDWLAKQPAPLAATLGAITRACARIGEVTALGALSSTHASIAFHANERIGESLAACAHVAGWSNVAHDHALLSDWHGASGQYLVVYDALDAASNADANAAMGTIFSVLHHPFRGTSPGAAGFLQPGRKQVAAGYVIYGASTVLVLSAGDGVQMYTLDRRDGRWRRAHEQLMVPAHTSEFAINSANQRFWEKPVQRYVAECLSGEDGPRGKNFNMRWVASLSAEVHRILTRGGVFLCPRDSRPPFSSGRLRLLHAAAPMAFLIEQAGGAAVTGTQELLDVVPDTLHAPVPVILGARAEVELVVRYHAEPSQNTAWQLFKTRSLFVQPQA
jgi:fructose-1,6-bisphosphatase